MKQKFWGYGAYLLQSGPPTPRRFEPPEASKLWRELPPLHKNLFFHWLSVVVKIHDWRLKEAYRLSSGIFHPPPGQKFLHLGPAPVELAGMPRLFVLLISIAWSLDPVSSAIEQAQSLALKKDRQEAAKVLNKAIEAAAPPLRGRAKLIETQSIIAKVFFTDKGQKLYESGQSAMFENPEIALTQYKEALALEDENILLLDNIARVQLGKQDCTSAEATVQKARTLYPFAPEPAVLELRALICLKNFDLFREKSKALPALEKGQDAFVQYLTALDLLQQKQWRKAAELLAKVSEEEPRFPETYYLLTKTGAELGRETDAWAQKYVSLCKGITVRERKRLSLEPRVCANAKEVEDELAKKTDL